jgi:hypothetical protein
VAAAAGAAAAGAAAAAPAAPAPRLQGKARLQARLRALDQMSRRVAKAAQTIVKGVPTPLPSHKQVTDAARQARPAGGGAGGAGQGNGMTSPTAGQRQQQGQQQQQLGSSHASGLHRLARGSAVNYSPFHHKRPHPADSEASSSGSSGGCLLLALAGCWVLGGRSVSSGCLFVPCAAAGAAMGLDCLAKKVSAPLLLPLALF